MTATAPQIAEKPRLLFFYSPTAGASVRVDGFLAQVLQRRHNHDTFLLHRIDVTKRPDLAERFRVACTPAVCVIDGNKLAAKAETLRGCADLQKLLQPWLR